MISKVSGVQKSNVNFKAAQGVTVKMRQLSGQGDVLEFYEGEKLVIGVLKPSAEVLKQVSKGAEPVIAAIGKVIPKA